MRADVPTLGQSLTRRQALGSSLALGAFLLPGSIGAAPRRGRARGVIVLMLEGGMSHLESWDPKPNAPAEVRGEFQPIATSNPALRVSEYLPCLSRQAHLYNVIRSVNCDARNDHSPGMHILLTGWENTAAGVAMERSNFQHPGQGSVIAKLRGVTTADGLPRNVALPRRGQLSGQVNFATPSFLGPGFDAWETGTAPAGSSQAMTMPPGLVLDRQALVRLGDRMALRSNFNQLNTVLDQHPTPARMNTRYQVAYQMLAGQRLCQAMDLSQESPRLRATYGDNVVGQSLLLSRRLVEAGVNYVLVNPYSGNVWDFHAGNFTGHRRMMPPMDRGVAALLADLEQRGLLDDVLVLVAGEMGRTPRINNNAAGRDHWTFAYSLLLAGGGLTRGQVLGSTTSQGEWPSRRPVTVPEILATIYHQLGIDPNTLLEDDQGRPIAILPNPTPIRELIA